MSTNPYYVEEVPRGPLVSQPDTVRAISTSFNKLNELIRKHNSLSVKTFSFSDLTSHPTTLAGYGITDAAPLHHTHPISDIIGLQTELDHLQSQIDTGPGAVHWADILDKPLTFTPPIDYYDSRFYQQSIVDGLLAGKAALVHNHDDLYYRKASVDTLLSGKVNHYDDFMSGFAMQPIMLTFDLTVPLGDILRVTSVFDVSATLDVEGTFEVMD